MKFQVGINNNMNYSCVTLRQSYQSLSLAGGGMGCSSHPVVRRPRDLGSIPMGGIYFSFLKRRNCLWLTSILDSSNTATFPQVKAARAWSWPLSPCSESVLGINSMVLWRTQREIYSPLMRYLVLPASCELSKVYLFLEEESVCIHS